MRVVIAPDKFKGSLSAPQVAAAVAVGLREVVPDVEAIEVPVADGGDGTLDAALSAGFTRVPVRVAGPTGEPVDTAYAVRDEVAVVELADACGLNRLPGGQLAALTASSSGLGQLVRAALDAGCRRIVLGIGGSASTDGGAGMLAELGVRLLDGDCAPLPPGGGALGRLDRVDLSGLHPAVGSTEMLLASDVDNPLLGPTGAAEVYGPQKGASLADVQVLERGLSQLVTVLAEELPNVKDAASAPGAGAAGGVGFAALALLGAQPRPGIDLLLELIDFQARLPGADLVVTGEGSLDVQTLHGKAPAGVAAAARAARVPVVAVAGRSLLRTDELAGAGIAAAYPLSEIEPDPARSMADAGPLLQQMGQRIAQDWLENS
jgi:glycerate 2-kinase